MPSGSRAREIKLSDAEREELVRWSRGAVADKLALRAGIVLACADGVSNAQVAAEFAVTTATVGKWRGRFAQERLEGLRDGERSGRPKAGLVVSEAEREQLTRWARRAKTSQDLALRAKIVLRCADGVGNAQVAEELAVSAATVNRWRTRFVERRLSGLADEPRPGRPPVIAPDQVEEVINATLESSPPDGAGRWSRTAMAEHSGLSPSTIGRIWRRFDLKPHIQDGFTLSADPQFVARVVDVAGLYHNPPEKAVVLCVDTRSRIVLDRSRPAPAAAPALPERRSRDQLRRAVATLFAAYAVDGETVVGPLRRRQRGIEFKKFLAKMDKTVPEELEVHLVCDHDGTHRCPEIVAWLTRHPRFHLHFTPTGPSWINQVERWFGHLAERLPRRGVQQSVRALENDIKSWIDAWHGSPQPFAWSKTAEEVAQSRAEHLTRIAAAAQGKRRELSSEI